MRTLFKLKYCLNNNCALYCIFFSLLAHLIPIGYSKKKKRKMHCFLEHFLSIHLNRLLLAHGIDECKAHELIDILLKRNNCTNIVNERSN